jgi:hypothetical protein
MLRDGVRHGSNLQLNLNSVTNGTYLVYLYAFSEGNPSTFSLNLEGQTVLRDYTTGSAGWWARLGPFQVTVADQAINLVHTGGNFMLSGIEIRQPTGASNQPPALGLQAYWPFNASTTMGEDASGNDNTGTLHNAPTWISGGRVGGSMEMANDQGKYMSVSTPGLNWRPTQFTVSWWLYPESYNTANQTLGSAIGWGGFRFQSTPNGSVEVGTDFATRITTGQYGTTMLYRWQHFAFTFDNGTGRFYKDGVLLVVKTGMTNPLAWGGFLVGSATPASAIHGLVDEVRVYNRALQDAEVSRTASFFTALTCRWKPDAEGTDWNLATNWEAGTVPTSNDDVQVDLSTNLKYPVLASNVRINNLTMTTGAGLDLQGHTLTVSRSASLSSASINSNGGTLRANVTSGMTGCSFSKPSAQGGGPITLHNTGLKTSAEIFVSAHGDWSGSNWGGSNRFYNVATVTNGMPIPLAQASSAILGSTMSLGGTQFDEAVTINNYGFGMVLSGNAFKKKMTLNFVSNSYWGVRIGDCQYGGEATFINGSGAFIEFNNANVFEGKVSLINPHPPISYVTYGNSIRVTECSGCINTFKGPVEVTNTSRRSAQHAPVDVRFGNHGGQTTFTNTASLTISSGIIDTGIPGSTGIAGGFSRGTLLLRNCKFQNPLATSLTLTSAGPADTYLVIGGGTSFAGNFTVSSPRLLLNGGTFAGTATFTKTGPCLSADKTLCPDNSEGGNTFRRKATFTNQAGADSPLNLATQKDDVVQQ